MRKTILSLLCGVVCTLAASAQTYAPNAIQDRPPFGVGKHYVSTSITGLDLHYNGTEKWNLDLSAKGGYLFADNWMVTGQLGYDYRKHDANAFNLGAGLRYYIEQNGLYLGLGANYVHKWHNYDDLLPSLHIGYAYFLNRTVTLEPEVYYNQSLKNHSDYSGFGVRIGLGIYFE